MPKFFSQYVLFILMFVFMFLPRKILFHARTQSKTKVTCKNMLKVK